MQVRFRQCNVDRLLKVLPIYWFIVGVPYFIINDKPQFSGAQDTETFIQVFANVSKSQL